MTVIVESLNTNKKKLVMNQKFVLGFTDSDALICHTCGEEKATKKCSKCKAVQYCDRECQRLHWFIHKKNCARLSSVQVRSEAPSEKEKLDEVNAATEALLSELSLKADEN